jgi:hypothetical protein
MLGQPVLQAKNAHISVSRYFLSAFVGCGTNIHAVEEIRDSL